MKSALIRSGAARAPRHAPKRAQLAKLSAAETQKAITEMRAFYWRLYNDRRLDEAACVCSCLKMLGSDVWPRPDTTQQPTAG